MTVTHGNSYLCPSRILKILPISLFPRAHSRAQKISDGVCACVRAHVCTCFCLNIFSVVHCGYCFGYKMANMRSCTAAWKLSG